MKETYVLILKTPEARSQINSSSILLKKQKQKRSSINRITAISTRIKL